MTSGGVAERPPWPGTRATRRQLGAPRRSRRGCRERALGALARMGAADGPLLATTVTDDRPAGPTPCRLSSRHQVTVTARRSPILLDDTDPTRRGDRGVGGRRARRRGARTGWPTWRGTTTIRWCVRRPSPRSAAIGDPASLPTVLEALVTGHRAPAGGHRARRVRGPGSRPGPRRGVRGSRLAGPSGGRGSAQVLTTR